MNNAPAILRSLIVSAVCVPLAIFFGYLLTDPLNRSTVIYFGILALLLISPLLLRWHQLLLALSWNMTAVLFFLPGHPALWLAMAAISLGILLLRRALGDIKHIISVPQVTWSLICLTGAVILTAKMRGVGLQSMGSDVYGGRHYISLLGAIMGYFALSGLRIPPERAGLYIKLFFLSALVTIISDLYAIAPGFLHFIFLLFPPNQYYITMIQSGGTEGLRLASAWPVSFAIHSYMLARYGIRGIFLSGKHWRWIVFCLAAIYGLFGGFRTVVLLASLMFTWQFYLEGLHRTKLLPILAFIGISTTVALVSLAPRLPYSIQRTLSVLPGQADSAAQKDAAGSSQWRFDMWKGLVPQIPQYLLLGKGYGVSAMDFNELTGPNAAIHVRAGFEENQYMALAGAFHNGPLSVILLFGIWGVIAVTWYWIAGMWVLYRNYRYGDPTLRTVNMFLMIAFGTRILFFIFVFGGIESDMLYFGGWLGLSVALNGGVCHPVTEPVQETSKLRTLDAFRPQFRPAFTRPKIGV
jgi:hypothetical protein